jgi:hypothetical protein
LVPMNRWGHSGTNKALKELRCKMIGYRSGEGLSTICGGRAIDAAAIDFLGIL